MSEIIEKIKTFINLNVERLPALPSNTKDVEEEILRDE
jgi:hypothetical protein